jgi:hypothetical protein
MQNNTSLHDVMWKQRPIEYRIRIEDGALECNAVIVSTILS